MKTGTQDQKEKKNRKKGFWISFFVHMGVLAICLLPFMSVSNLPEMPDDAQAIMINFIASPDRSLSPSQSSASEAPPKPEVKPEEIKPETKPEEKPQPKPKPKPKPVVLSPKPEPVVLPEASEPSEKPSREVEIPQAKPEVEAPAETTSTEASSATPANGTSGTANSPGQADEGNDIEDFAGDGVFGRRVIYRPDIKKLSKEDGKIVVGVCVDRDGKVLNAKFIKEDSTLDDPELVQMAEIYTKQYRFAKDYKAPAKQCGKLTYIIKVSN